MNFFKDIQKKLNSGEISYGTALLLSDMSEDERKIIYSFLKNFYLGANKMKEVVENLIEISKRDNLNLENLIKNKKIKEITKRLDIGKKQKGELLRKLLFKMRYPEFSKKKEKINSIINKLPLKKSIKLNYNRNFEDKKIKLEIEFKNLTEFEKILEVLKNNKNIIDEIIKNI